jgi:hypothetical protein
MGWLLLLGVRARLAVETRFDDILGKDKPLKGIAAVPFCAVKHAVSLPDQVLE